MMMEIEDERFHTVGGSSLKDRDKERNGDETPHVTPEFSIKNARLMDRVFKEIGY